MSHHDHRPGVSQASLVTRKLKVKPDAAGHISAAVTEIDTLSGLDSVSYDADHRKLHLAYDAKRLCIDDIEEVLARHGVDISSGRWNRIKEDYYRFIDQNVKDNAKQKPWSCH
ncbi:cation transporter [Halomonas sp. CKK8]|uniref:cation transporter n=1 Tax=Halomonas sp. CKK8 TaxID=3036127 RepID=UPI002415739F|nr:cation transporter [Halomonas sp. CKK8]WFM73112.1 cation transporter [Halomonas sp. CKK8]